MLLGAVSQPIVTICPVVSESGLSISWLACLSRRVQSRAHVSSRYGSAHFSLPGDTASALVDSGRLANFAIWYPCATLRRFERKFRNRGICRSDARFKVSRDKALVVVLQRGVSPTSMNRTSAFRRRQICIRSTRRGPF